MSWLLRPFGTLQWRLTLTYIMVTVLTVLTLEGALLVTLDIIFLNAPEQSSSLVQQLQPSAAQAAPYLSGNSPNVPVLTLQAQDVRDARYVLTERVSFAASTATPELVLILDTHGVIQATATNTNTPDNPLTQPTMTPDITQVYQLPQSQAVIAAALAGTTNENALRKTLADGKTIVIAVPIENNTQQVVGALFVEMIGTPNLRVSFLNSSWRVLLPSAVLLTIGAAFVGSIFGLLTARWLTGRLRILMGAANAWSQGDFSAIAHDSSNDELGQLARHLNSMAVQIETLLHERQGLAVIEERNRLARDLHDSVKQQIFATAMQLAAARSLLDQNPEAARTHVVEAETLTNQAQQELTTLIRELRPVALEDKGLAGALENYVADWSRQAGIAASVRIQGEQFAPLDIEQALYRVAQEALANVARHSNASNVDVHLAWEPGILALTIRDNGQGFDVARASGKGTGLWSMRQRVEALHGALNITSLLPGTRIEAQVPLENEGHISNPRLAVSDVLDTEVPEYEHVTD